MSDTRNIVAGLQLSDEELTKLLKEVATSPKPVLARQTNYESGLIQGEPEPIVEEELDPAPGSPEAALAERSAKENAEKLEEFIQRLKAATSPRASS